MTRDGQAYDEALGPLRSFHRGDQARGAAAVAAMPPRPRWERVAAAEVNNELGALSEPD